MVDGGAGAQLSSSSSRSQGNEASSGSANSMAASPMQTTVDRWETSVLLKHWGTPRCCHQGPVRPVAVERADLQWTGGSARRKRLPRHWRSRAMPIIISTDCQWLPRQPLPPMPLSNFPSCIPDRGLR